MTQPPKWRVWTINCALGLRDRPNSPPGNYRIYDLEGAPTVLGEKIQVIELSAVKELVDALKRIASAESFVGYAFDGNHQFKSLFDEMVLRRKLAEDTLAKLPAEVLGED